MSDLCQPILNFDGGNNMGTKLYKLRHYEVGEICKLGRFAANLETSQVIHRQVGIHKNPIFMRQFNGLECSFKLITCKWRSISNNHFKVSSSNWCSLLSILELLLSL